VVRVLFTGIDVQTNIAAPSVVYQSSAVDQATETDVRSVDISYVGTVIEGSPLDVGAVSIGGKPARSLGRLLRMYASLPRSAYAGAPVGVMMTVAA
jgi:hypothetical protein